MVTKNWYMAIKSNMIRKVIPGGLTTWDGSHAHSGYSTSGTNVMESVAFYMTKAVFASGTEGIVLGSGTTPATVYDYALESLITSGLNANVVRSADGGDNLVYVLTLTNTSVEEITIGEIGIVDQAYTGEGSGYKQVLMERTVLDSPVTLSAGAVAVVTYTISLAIPQA